MDLQFLPGLAPDTNENAATGVCRSTIYGLPFTLDPTARKQSGVGLAGDIGGEWSPLLADNLKARIGVDLIAWIMAAASSTT